MGRAARSIRARAAGCLALPVLLLPLASFAQISLPTAVDLAVKSSPAVRAAQANVQHATAAVQESRDAYVPNLVAGGSPGYFYGFPLGYPSLFSLNSSSMVLSFSQPDYIRAARSALNAASLNLKDAEQQVALDVSLSYVELDHDLAEIAALDEEKSYAGSLVSMEQDRVQAGVDPRVSELQAELTEARVDEKRIHLQDDADEMRQKIAHLTSLPTGDLTTVSSSIPPPPSFTSDPAPGVAQNAPGISAAYANAKAKYFTAFGDSRQNYRPTLIFGGQYSRFAQFNNYSQYFQNFVYNNFGAGVQITFPLFDATRRAKARESGAEAVAAEAQADQSRNTLSEQTLLARRTILELGAEQRVARIQSELAQEQLRTVDAEMTSGSGSGSAQPVSPIEAQKAHIEERERYEDLLDTNFSLIKVQLNLLRMTGQIDDWIRSSLP
ncbi:MAG TPA: TolC family protein [Acidobacteriaceae bacterium]|nr:TolC family protein [Acidobacteriaceae bacterium]